MTAVLFMGLVKASLVMLLALATMPLLRRRSAALRHWVLIVALACAAAQPLLMLMAPRWTLPMTRVLPASNQFTTDSSIVLLDADVGSIGVATRGAAVVPVASTGERIGWVLFGVWLCGTSISLGALAVGMLRLVRITARAREASAAWLTATADIGSALGLGRSVRTVVTNHPALLVTWGVRRPVILAPSDADTWPADRIRAVVSHELAHVQRKDWPVQVAAEIVRACGWFHPLLWIACVRLRHESERACDDVVLGLGIERTSYADQLVALARTFKARGRAWLPAPAIVRPSTLQWRIRAMLNTNLDRRPVHAPTRLAILVTMLGASLSFAGLHAQTTSVTGILHDASGRVLPDASVRLVHQESGAKYETQSDQKGRFQITAVAPGDYLLSARHIGFSPLVEMTSVTSGETVHRELTLQVGSLQETISVRGGGPPDDKSARPRTQEVGFSVPACTPSSVGGQIIPPTKVRNVPPEYPQSLQDANVTGTILLLARIGVDGFVNDVRPFSNHDPGLEEAAVVAVKQWRFTPTLLNCQPIEVQMLTTITFSMTP